MSKKPIDSIITELVQYAIDQIGHCYVFGGAPGPLGEGCWDCSSFCNWMWGAAGGQTIPGYPNGTYNGAQHGPSTLTWLASQGTITGSIDRSLTSAGDLAVWRTHMGFCISNQEMVSAQTEATGTQRSNIDGFISNEPLTILRLAVVGPGGISLPIAPIPGSGAIKRVAIDIARETRNLVALEQRATRIGNRWFRT